MTRPENDRSAEDAAAYALNMLTDSERADIESRIANSDQLRDEVIAMTEAASLLGRAVEPIEPPAHLKADLMELIATAPQLPRESRTLHALDQGDASVPPPRNELSPSAQKVRTRWFARPAFAIIAAVSAAALVLGGGLVGNIVAEAGFQQQQADQLAAITAASDRQQVITPIETGGTATLIWSGELGLAAFIAEGLPALTADQTYELWYIDSEGAATPAGLFDVGDQERVWRVLDGEMRPGDTIGVTIEPRGGSDTPTTPPIVAISSAS